MPNKSIIEKAEITGYLVGLHTLLEAQSKGVTSVPSATLAKEYEKYWGLLKEMVTKEHEDDSRKS